MTARYLRPVLAAIVSAALLLVVARFIGSDRDPHSPVREMPEVGDPPGPAPIPDAVPEAPSTEQDPAPAGPQPTEGALTLELLGNGELQISGQAVRADDLIPQLAFLADEDRDTTTWNRVSRRELILRAPEGSRWASVRRILLAAFHPSVRIYRVYLATPDGPPIAVSVGSDWVAAEESERMHLVHIGVHISVELRRAPGEADTRVRLLDLDLGTGAAAAAALRAKCAGIHSAPGNSDYPAELDASGDAPFEEVLSTLQILWSVGLPRVRLRCLMPAGASWPIGTDGWNLEEDAGRLSKEERIEFLLDQLWSKSGLAADTAGFLIREAGAAVLPRLLSRMELNGLPSRGGVVEIVDCACGRVGPAVDLLHSFGPEAVPFLLEAAASRSPKIRATVVRALGGFPNAGPKVEEVIRRMADLDPDAEVRNQAKEAIQNLSDVRRSH
jgi:HEAT repeats